MNRVKKLLIAASLAAIAILATFALAARATESDLAHPFTLVDTLGHDAVVLELSTPQEPQIRILIFDGQMGTLQVAGESGALGIVVEEIDERGDSARLALYDLDSPYDQEIPKTGWLGDHPLVRGGGPVELSDGRVPGLASGVRAQIVDVVLARR